MGYPLGSRALARLVDQPFAVVDPQDATAKALCQTNGARSWPASNIQNPFPRREREMRAQMLSQGQPARMKGFA